jgi:hypothetical protein
VQKLRYVFGYRSERNESRWWARAGVIAVREAVLRAVGWALVIDEPVTPADIIVVLLDSGGAGALEAADLSALSSIVAKDSGHYPLDIPD